MSTAFTWSARLVDAAGEPVAATALEAQLFDLKANAWIAASNAKTDANGLAKGAGVIEDDTLPLAPALRLVEGAAVMSVSAEIARAARGGGLIVDFGQVQRLAVEDRFPQTRSLSARTLRGAGVTIGGMVAPQAPSEASRIVADQTAARALADRDLQLTRQASVLVERETEIGRLQEAAATLSTRLDQRDKDLAERDAQLADRARVISDREAEVARLAAVVTEQARTIAAQPRIGVETINPAVGLKTVAVTDLATTMATQLDDAQVTLKPRGFSLGAIQVTAKAVLQDDGGRLQLLGAEELKTVPPGALSDIRMEFLPDRSLTTADGLSVPDVGQLTENAARRVLASVGLLLEASVGPRALNPAVAPGQAMVQSPGPGASIARGARVLVIFAADPQQGL